MRRSTKSSILAIFSTVQVGVSLPCKLCGDEPIPTGALTRQGDGITCRSLYNDLGFLEEGMEECRNVQLTAFQSGCCSENYVPENICSLCPNGTPFRTGTRVPGHPGRRELTCKDLPSEASFLDFFTAPGECSDTFLQRSAAWCGCPGTEIECSLCPDGSQPPNLDKTENVLYGWDCSSFEYITALLSKNECHLSSHLLEFDAAAFCCPHVVQPPTACSFCPDMQIVGDPDKIVHTKYGTLKCGDIEQSISMVPTDAACASVKQHFDTDLCCNYPGESISRASDQGKASFLTLAVAGFIFGLMA